MKRRKEWNSPFSSTFAVLVAALLPGVPGHGSEGASVCSGWPEYTLFHGEALRGDRLGKYAIFRPDPWRGYANQLYGVASVFAFSLLTERAFLIDDRDLSRLFHSPRIDWDYSRVAGNVSRIDRPFVLDAMKDCESSSNLTAMLHSESELDYILSHDVIEISTNLLWWPIMFDVARFQGRIGRLDSADGDVFFGCAMKYLLQPQQVGSPWLCHELVFVRHSVPHEEMRWLRQLTHPIPPRPPHHWDTPPSPPPAHPPYRDSMLCDSHTAVMARPRGGVRPFKQIPHLDLSNSGPMSAPARQVFHTPAP